MASKSKRARQAAAKAKAKSAWPVLVWALIAALVGYLQNRGGQFSDIRGFYGMRFLDGLHHWPYDSYTPAGAANPLNPVEYPALTGIVMWILTYFVPKSSNPIFNYFALNAFVNAILFMGTAYFVRKMSDSKSTYLYIFAPAVVMALNLNWDLWAMLPMLAGIYYFDQKKYNLSAFLLGISIAAKFFPVVLLLPIAIHLIRKKEIKQLSKYVFVTSITWLLFNLPVMIFSFEGWKYFYTFSFSRGLGDGSIYSILNKIGYSGQFGLSIYYILNMAIFSALILYLIRNKENLDLKYSAFFTLFAFTYFGKQYSMQYILWLAPLGVIAFRNHASRVVQPIIYLYLIWQGLETLFRVMYFQNLISNINLARGTTYPNAVSDGMYASAALLRYGLVLAFTIYLMNIFLRTSHEIAK